MSLQRHIAQLVSGNDLSRDEAREAMNDIMSGNATDSQIAGFLVGLRMKGETVAEIAGCAEAMREKSFHVTTVRKDVVDTCGTGGDGTHTFNISTAAAIVAAGAGVPIAKHGNRSVSSKSGSADVLKALGVNIDIPTHRVGSILDEVGITFMFAPHMHQAMRFAMNARKELALRTVFNILGPLTNPANAQRQVLGVFAPYLTEVMAGVLLELGSSHALIVHGEGGLDELSTVGSTQVSELRNGTIKTYTVDVEELGMERNDMTDLLGSDASVNAEIIHSILNGQKGSQRNIVVLNAGAAIYVSRKADSLTNGVRQAEESIDNGSAKRLLKEWIDITMSVRP